MNRRLQYSSSGYHVQSCREMPRVLLYLMLVSVSSNIARAQKQPESAKAEPITEQREQGASLKHSTDEDTFKRLFVKRRIDHFDAVKSLRAMDSYERLYKVVSVLFEKLFEVIAYSRIILEDADYVPNHGPFPKNDTVKDALSNILENTALFSDIVLQLPDLTQRILRTQHTWNTTISWALTFINQTRYLLDKPTADIIHLMSQELNLTQRESTYVNPYLYQKPDETHRKKKSPSKKEKRKKGPQMVKIEL